MLGTFGSQGFCRLLCVLWFSYALKQVLIHLSFFRRMMQKSWKSFIFAWALPQIESSFSILTQRRLKLYSSEIKSVISRKLLKEVHFSRTRLKYSKTFYFCRYFIWDYCGLSSVLGDFCHQPSTVKRSSVKVAASVPTVRLNRSIHSSFFFHNGGRSLMMMDAAVVENRGIVPGDIPASHPGLRLPALLSA